MNLTKFILAILAAVSFIAAIVIGAFASRLESPFAHIWAQFWGKPLVGKKPSKQPLIIWVGFLVFLCIGASSAAMVEIIGPPSTIIPPAITVIAPNNSGLPVVSPSFSPIIEEFEDATDFIQTTPNIYIDRGRVHWEVSRNGGEQYIYRVIPSISSDVDVRLTVVGQIDDWTNNCKAGAGIGDAPGEGPAIYFGYYGGGCPQSGANIRTGGVNIHISEESCNFDGQWAWIERATPYRAALEIKGSSATLLVEDVAKVFATKSYSGEYSVLWVGMTGFGDYPTCSGIIDSVTVEPN